jgi:ribosomal protein S20
VTALPSPVALVVVAADVAAARAMPQRVKAEVPSHRAVARPVIHRRQGARARSRRVRAPRRGPKEADPVARDITAVGKVMAAVELAIAKAVKAVASVEMAADGAAATERLSRRQVV